MIVLQTNKALPGRKPASSGNCSHSIDKNCQVFNFSYALNVLPNGKECLNGIIH